MPGRKQPPEREEDRDREYRMAQKRGFGEDTEDAPGAEKIRDAGSEVAREREKHAEDKERLSRQDF